ncbi:Nuclear receptor 2C2-associated protein [Kickxella alabastrina]|uniref:Nuclear receptor 2C2-associated protein n=1 Tax=Kickxella alabastrina TaxID=61397 RepID=A0ACC1I0P9_9FUNG|nr:Nuclear receptor 2C2-associated protein [Kickxella alabastrina]
MSSESLTKWISKSKVSTVLNKDVKTYGRNNLFDDNTETCWNSEQGTPQWIMVEFTASVQIHSIHMQFQGGFAGKSAQLFDMMATGVPQSELVCPLHVEDNNRVQEFVLPQQEQGRARRRVKVVFGESTDFYGRIVVYSMNFTGRVLDHSAVAAVDGSSAGASGVVADMVIV